MTDARKKEYTLRITHANRTQLVVILYEILEDYIQDAKDSFAAGEQEEFREAIRKAKSCVRELIASLHLEYEVAGNLYQMYRYVHRQMIAAETKNSAEPLAVCKTVMAQLKEAYAEACKEDHSEALWGNTQAVYAGLTYGKDDIKENLTDQGINRGFRA